MKLRTVRRLKESGLVVLGLAACLSLGCRASGTRVELTTFQGPGDGTRLFTRFDRASYRQSPDGILEMVFRTQQPSTIDPTQTITQILYVKTFWFPQPGKTYVERSQINASVVYALLTPPTGVRYDGTGFLTYEIEEAGDDLKGLIESGTLTARFAMGEATPPFDTTRIEGHFEAKNEPGAVVNALNMLETLFQQRVASGE